MKIAAIPTVPLGRNSSRSVFLSVTCLPPGRLTRWPEHRDCESSGARSEASASARLTELLCDHSKAGRE